MKTGVRFCGQHYLQSDDCSEVTTHLNDYCATIPVVTEASKDADDEPTTLAEQRDIMGANGRLGWAARHGRMQIAFSTSWTQQALSGSTKKLLRDVNAVICKARKPYWRKFVGLRCHLTAALVVSSGDGSQGSMPRHGSQTGVAVFLCNPAILQGDSTAVLVEYGSPRLVPTHQADHALQYGRRGGQFLHGV